MERSLKDALTSTAPAPQVDAGLTEGQTNFCAEWRKLFINDRDRDTTLSDEAIWKLHLSADEAVRTNVDEFLDMMESAERPNEAPLPSPALTDRSMAALALVAASNKQFESDMEKVWDAKEVVSNAAVILGGDLFGIKDHAGAVLRAGIYTDEQRHKLFPIPYSTFISDGHPKHALKATHCLTRDKDGKHTVITAGLSDEYPTSKKNKDGRDTAGKGSRFSDYARTLPWVLKEYELWQYFSTIKDDRTKAKADHKSWTTTAIVSERDRHKNRVNYASTGLKRIVALYNKLDAINTMKYVGAYIMIERRGDDIVPVAGNPIMVFDKRQPGVSVDASITTFLNYVIKSKDDTYEMLVSSASRDTGTPKTQASTINLENWSGVGSEFSVWLHNTGVAQLSAKIRSGTLTDDEKVIIGLMHDDLDIVYAEGSFAADYLKLIAQRKELEAKEAAAKIAALHNAQVTPQGVADAVAADKAGSI